MQPTCKVILFAASFFLIAQGICGLTEENVKGVRELVNIDGQEYFFDVIAHERDEAKAQCESMNKNLVTFDSIPEWYAVTEWLRDNDYGSDWFWTGAMRDPNTTNWYWEPTGEDMTTFFWGSKQPTLNETYDIRVCMSFNANFDGWDDDNCDLGVNLGFMCE